MLAFTIRRLLVSIPVLIASTILVFMFVTIGQDPLADLKHKNPPAPPAFIKQREHDYLLDRSLPYRYWHWFTGVIHGDFGPSLRSGIDIRHELGFRTMNTFRLVILSIFVALFLAVIAGIVSAVRQYSKTDYTITTLGFLFLSLPVFWFATLLKHYAININQATGTQFFGTFGDHNARGVPPGILNHLYDWAGYNILPTITLSLVTFATWSRYQRASMLDVLNSDYIRLARAKGISRRRVLIRHAMRTSLIPMTTQVAIDAAGLFSGVAITEFIFNRPGLGQFTVGAISNVDPNATLAALLITAIIIIAFNLIADLLYAVLDPRIRLA